MSHWVSLKYNYPNLYGLLTCRRFHLTSGKHSGAGSRRGSSSSDDAEDVVSRGEVDLTIVFTVQPITQSQIDLLRSSKVKSHASQIGNLISPKY